MFAVHSSSVAQPNISRVEYYIDTDPGFGNATTLPIGTGSNLVDLIIPIDPTTLSEGVHRLYVRAASANGWSLTNTLLFYKPISVGGAGGGSTTPDISRVEYYIDNDPGIGNATALSITSGTNLSDLIIPLNPDLLTEGVHRLYVRAKSANGWSLTNTLIFYKPITVGGAGGGSTTPDISRIEYYIDNDPGFGNATSLSIGSGTELSDLIIPINPEGLSQGVHRLYVRASSANGWSLTNTLLFYKPILPPGGGSGGVLAPAYKLKRLEYFIDTDPGYGLGIPVALEQITDVSDLLVSINVNGLASGAHKLHTRSQDSSGAWSMVNSLDFNIPSALSGSAIIVNSISRNSLCGLDSFSVGYHVTGTYNSGNIFTAYLSDANGDFTSEQVVGSVTANSNGLIKCKLNSQLPGGNGYVVRIKSSNPLLTSIASSSTISILTGTTPTILKTGPATLCQGQKDTLTASAGNSYLWSTGETTQKILVDAAGTYSVIVSTSSCSGQASFTYSPVFNQPPSLSYTGNVGFVSSVVNPTKATPTSLFRFEVMYTDADGDLPASTNPRLLLDFEGNGSFIDPNDRLFNMLEVNPNDQDVTDGKDYYFVAAALPQSANWKTTILAADQVGCSVQFGPFSGPEVTTRADLSIFANDITFSDAKPEINSQITVYATIHNNSGQDANNFTVHLVNQFQPGVVYPDIVVPYLSSNPINNSIKVSWVITTPGQPAWCPMQVFVDYGNSLDEPNELDNQAIRPYTNGRFTLPGDIKITAAANPSPALIGSLINVSGTASYRNTAVVLADPSCAGATFTATLVETNQIASGYTNANGDYSILLQAPVTAGTYHVKMNITDFTLDGDTTTTFQVIVVPPCVGPTLVSSISVSAGTIANDGEYPNTTIILQGQSLTATATVTNSGTAASTAATLQIDLPDGTPVPGPFAIPALNPGASYTVNLPAMTFNKLGSTYIRPNVFFNVVGACNNVSNTSIRNILVLPALPDINPEPGGIIDAYQCEFNSAGSVGFTIKNLGGIPTGSFNARLTVTHNSTVVNVLNQNVSSIEPLKRTSINFDFAQSALSFEVGTYQFTLECDIPNTVTEVSESNNESTTIVNLKECFPDISVLGCGSLDVKPTDPLSPGNINIYATVANGGKLATSAAFTVDFNVAGTHYTSIITDILNPGSSKQISITVPAPSHGNNQLTVSADITNTILESAESNNTATANLCWDFELTNKTCSSIGTVFIDPIQYVGRPVKLQTGLFNLGLYEASHIQVKFEVSGPGLSGWQNLGYVSSFADNTCGCPIGLVLPGQFAFPQEGSYQVRITADFNSEYSECNEANNQLVIPITVTNKPDYFVKSEYIAPSLLNPDVNQSVIFDITYTNNGEGNGNSFEVFTQADNDPLDSAIVLGVLGGQTNTVRMNKPWSSSIRGVHVIRAIVDHDNVVEESDELNNEATRSIVVGLSPNLKFNAFTVTDSLPATGSVVNISAIIKNNGYTGIYATYQLYFIDNSNAEVLIRQQSIAVDSAASVQLLTPWIVTDPKTTLLARIINPNPIEYDATDNEVMLEIGKMVSATSSINASCSTSSDGIGRVTIAGGIAPYFKIWSNGYSGDSIIAKAGRYEVTITDAEGSSVIDSLVIGAGLPPVVSYSGLTNTYRADDAAVTLTGIPAGGVFTGPGISGNQFNPATAGVGGPYTIVYKFITPEGCGDSAFQTTTVLPPLINASVTLVPQSWNLVFCPSASFGIAYTASGTFNAGNIFTVQLSDENGSFTNPVSIGTVASTTSGTMQCILANNQPAGTRYRIRIVSSDPSVISPDNGTDIDIRSNSPYFRDLDGDGFGDPSQRIDVCINIPGYVTNNDDCNDNINAIHPGVLEICDGIDNNCNGLIDEGMTSTYYRDADGDGFGIAGFSIQACGQPVGYTSDNTDCDDGNAAVYPAASSDTIINNLSNVICVGTSVTFSCIAVNGGSSPVYQWKKNGINVGSNNAQYTDANLANGDQIICELTSNAACVINANSVSNIIVMTVNPLPVVSTGTYGPFETTSGGVTLTGSPAGGAFSGPGVSGNTFDPATAGLGNHIITYTYTDATTGCSNTATTTIAVNVPCVFTVDTLAGPRNACPYIGISTLNATYSIAATSASSYSWTLPAGATLVSGTLGSPSIEVHYASSFVSGTITVTVTSLCGGPTTRSQLITKAVPAVPAAITGILNACPYIATNIPVTYSITPVQGAITYRWTLPATVTLLSASADSTSIVISYNTGFDAGANKSIKVRSVSGCGNSADRTLNISVTKPATPGVITGPANACIFIGTANEATYTIRSVTNANSYSWNVPAGATIMSHPNGTGALDTAITVVFDNSFVSATAISVQSVSGCGSSTARTLAISRTLPTTPGIITGVTNACPLMGTDITSIYTVRKVANALSYNWVVPTGAFASHPNGPGINDTIISVVFNNSFISGAITVNAANGCGNSANRLLNITRLVPATPGVINGPTDPCPNVGGTDITYTIRKVLNATSYTWTVPSGVTITGHPAGLGINDTSITVTFDNTVTTGNISVIANNNCSSSVPRNLALARKLPATPGVITGPSNPCPYIGVSDATYTIRKVLNATSYTWSVPAGAIISGHPGGNGINDTIINVTFTNAVTTGNISVVASNNCSSSLPRNLVLARLLPATPGVITGPTDPCPYIGVSAVTYTIRKVANAGSYTWSVPVGASISSHPGGTGVNDTIITVTFTNAIVNDNISVTANNSCASSLPRSLALVKKLPGIPGTISTTILKTTCPDRQYFYSIAGLPANATSLLWTAPAGGRIISQGTLSVVIEYGPGVIADTLRVVGVNNCTKSTERKIAVSLVDCPSFNTVSVKKNNLELSSSSIVVKEDMKVKVYPNPSSSYFRLQLTSSSKERATLRIFDITGRTMSENTVVTEGINKFGYNLPNGIYFVEVIQGKQSQIIKVIKY